MNSLKLLTACVPPAAQHTPGPWHVDTYLRQRAVLADGSGVIAASVTNESDARLIAAAPDLLEALRNLLAIAEDFDTLRDASEPEATEISAARAALAKVEGS